MLMGIQSPVGSGRPSINFPEVRLVGKYYIEKKKEKKKQSLKGNVQSGQHKKGETLCTAAQTAK